MYYIVREQSGSHSLMITISYYEATITGPSRHSGNTIRSERFRTTMKISSFAFTTALLLARKATTSAFTASSLPQSIFRQCRGNEVILASSNVARLLASSSSSAADQELQEGQMLDVSRFMSGSRPEGTEDFIMQQTMVRVKDPEKSLAFYCDVLGFKLIHYSEVGLAINC